MRLILMILRLILRAVCRLLEPLGGAWDRVAHPERDGAFRDHARRRSVPYRLYAPEGVEGPAPVVIFSHGLGGSCEAAPYLGRALAAAGYWGVFIQHPGSDRGTMQGAGSREAAIRRLRQSTADPANMRDRFRDLPFVIDRLEAMTAPGGRHAGRFDMARLGMAGHSYGARSVMVAAGQRLAGAGLAFRDGRVRAGLLLSPSGTRRPGAGEPLLPEAEFAAIDIPLLHVTGTRDTPGSGFGQPAPPGGGDIQARLAPYRAIRAPEQYLLVFDGATHSAFSGTGRNETPPDTRYTRATALAAVLFFDACLKGSAAARAALRDEFPGQLAPGDRFEFR